jgi:hypothetical protein
LFPNHVSRRCSSVFETKITLGKQDFQEVGERGNIKGTTMIPGFDFSPRVRIVCKHIKKGDDVNIIS